MALLSLVRNRQRRQSEGGKEAIKDVKSLVIPSSPLRLVWALPLFHQPHITLGDLRPSTPSAPSDIGHQFVSSSLCNTTCLFRWKWRLCVRRMYEDFIRTPPLHVDIRRPQRAATRPLAYPFLRSSHVRIMVQSALSASFETHVSLDSPNPGSSATQRIPGLECPFKLDVADATIQ